MKLNNKGYIEDAIFGGLIFLGILATVIIFGGLIFLGILATVIILFLAIFSKWEWSEDNVSGIIYNTTNNGAISGNTNFSVRAAVDTYVSEENQSSYCLPQNSQYKELVNKAAADKEIKVQVTTQKGFWLKAPWTCIDNVVVTEVKE